ncbi:hypothetical protein [Granulosicoccus antarcticus]|uniref:Uncharacterized protein n=1 Tax=Granulosicoccus antarcticus IMCC3135 TaxID=1192854 RepID=A0A2Z2NXY5_9GAMM|nr:hypothetical protein [Granulosicoccus antarcticus]ASJ72617.1 hypothetical protein IMCC3135_12645 [Granulosicoccus antarcticus IMCC3135]
MSKSSQRKKSNGPKLVMAAAAAGALLVMFVLPAEHGVDLTGFGKLTGINALASTTVEKAGTDFGQNLSFNVEEYDLEAEEINRSIRGMLKLEDAPFMSETIVLEIDDLGEIEHKFIIPENSTLVYSWKLLNPEGDGVFYEFHGHPSTADASNYPDGFEMAYSKGEGRGQNGSFTAAFPGYHGWYFMNLEEGPIQIELTVSGYYSEHKEMYRAVDGKVINNVEF